VKPYPHQPQGPGKHGPPILLEPVDQKAAPHAGDAAGKPSDAVDEAGLQRPKAQARIDGR